jgi:uncharacterized protein YbaA (DUF1428 family)
MYVDGFVLAVPRKNLPAYRRMSRKAGRIWREHGALEYRECAGDDLKVEGVLGFPKLLKLKGDEVAVFAWIIYKSRAHRDRVNAKVLSDKRMMTPDASAMPFDVGRMAYGGFKVFVDE